MSSFHNLTADLPHPAHHDGSQLLPYDDFDYMPGSNFDEDDIISVNPPDVNVVDAPVVRLKPGRPSSDIWTWFTSDTNSHHLNNCNMSRRLINEMKGCDRPDWGTDHKYIVEDIARVIRKYNSTEFADVVTDNTSTKKKAWTLLREIFPSCYFKGCCSHGIHLLVKDIIAATKTKQAGNTETTYPIDYSFQEMLEFIVDFRDVTKMFHNHRVVKAWLQELKKTTNSRVLVRPAPTRWETIQQMCQRLLDSESHLDTISSARNFIKGTAAQQAERQKVKDIITDD
ncbi:hypothetical protein BASA50_008982 [Batrachochytrium salamandrivorans]|uniref:DUF659 domain-containing protein n=1 Tax=Batrachochytrium salamandrivorans TaxID=1357716 RepID=A0ABQ8F3K9_9FUNG|nr:hypothetical protein BASA50_008982 [Batrachochytrium salamandrivorans]